MSSDDTPPSEQQLRRLQQQGFQLAQMMGLFSYFLHHTPEGKQIIKDMEQQWQQACQQLRADKQLVGSEFSCSQWWHTFQKELLRQSPPPKKPVKTAPKTKIKTPRHTRKPILRFKNIP